MNTTLTMILTALAISGSSTHAAVLAADNFTYTNGELFGKGIAGSGWAGAWSNGFGNNTAIIVTSGIVSGQATSEASLRLFRQLAPTVGALTDGSVANDGVTIFLGIDYRFGGFYGGFELVNSGTLNMQLGTQGSGPVLLTGGTVHVPTASFGSTTGVDRYIMAITYNNTTGDMVQLFKNGVSIGSSTANASNNFSFNQVGFGVFIQPSGSILHADNLIIATTFAEAIPEPSLSLLGAIGLLALLRRRR